MKRVVKLMGVLAIVAAIAAPAVMARVDGYRPGPTGQIGSMYVKQPRPVGDPVGMPRSTPSGSEGFAATANRAQAGPLSLTVSDVTAIQVGGAIVAPRGGAVYTPQQRANLSIRKTIRALD